MDAINTSERAPSQALIEGQQAGKLGLAAGLNPYEVGSQAYQDWYRGWFTAVSYVDELKAAA